jgi:hypothetical protein
MLKVYPLREVKYNKMKKLILSLFCLLTLASPCFGTDYIIDSYPTSNHDAVWNLGYIYQKIGHSITGDGRPLDKIQWYLYKVGNPSGNSTAYLYEHSGTFGTSSVPTGSALATSSTYEVSNLTGDPQLISFTFSSPYTLVNGTNYVITLEYGNGSSGNLVFMCSDTSSPSHAGNDCFYAGSWIASALEDLVFYAISYTAGATENIKGLTGKGTTLK